MRECVRLRVRRPRRVGIRSGSRLKRNHYRATHRDVSKHGGVTGARLQTTGEPDRRPTFPSIYHWCLARRSRRCPAFGRRFRRRDQMPVPSGAMPREISPLISPERGLRVVVGRSRCAGKPQSWLLDERGRLPALTRMAARAVARSAGRVFQPSYESASVATEV